MAAACKALAGDEGGLLALNMVRLDHGYDVRARALAALRDDNLNVDPDNPHSGGCGSSLALEESKGSHLNNRFDNSNMGPDDLYGGRCGSSLGSEEADARHYQDPMVYYGGGSESS